MARTQITRTCEQCGVTFSVKPYRATAARWCSRRCSRVAHAAITITKPCEHCGTTFTQKHEPSRADRRFCSPACRNTHRRRPLIDRFHQHVKPSNPSDCWPWRGHLNNKGYGQIYSLEAGREVLAHRAAWELEHGSIPDGLRVLHRCDNPPCCNPSHLFLGTQRDNIHDMVAKQRISHGTHRPNAKLTDDQVRAIRSTTISGRQLSKQLGVSEMTISRVRSGKTWRHIPH